MNIYKTTHLVKTILINRPNTRGNDYLLWLEVINRWGFSNGFHDFAKRANLETFLKELRFMDCPCFETVSRSRRKLQEKYPELRASAETQAARAELEEAYREYAHTDV